MLTKSLNNDKPHKYGCLMLSIPDDIADQIRAFNATIPDHHLGIGGREEKIHVTIKYGFTEDTPEQLAALEMLVRDCGVIRLKLKTLSLFRGNEDGDVLKLDVDSPQLHRLNRLITQQFPCYNKYPTYIPHVTVAYLNPQFSSAYTASKPPFLNQEVICSQVEYSNAEKERVYIELPNYQMKTLSSLNATSGGTLVGTRKVVAPRAAVPLIGHRKKYLAYYIKAGFTGKKEDRRGRTICYQEGRRVSCNKVEGGTNPATRSKPATKPKPKKEKLTTEQVRGSVQEMINKGTISAREAVSLTTSIFSLTVVQINDLKRDLKVRASGNKAELAGKVADRIVAKIEALRDGTPEKPKRKPKQEKPSDDNTTEQQLTQETTHEQPEQSDSGADRGEGSTGVPEADAADSGPVEEEAGGSATESADRRGSDGGKPAAPTASRRIPASTAEVNKRIDRFEKFFRNKGQHQVADWMGQLRNHINAVGSEEALKSLAEDSANLPESGEAVQYWGVGTEEANWKNMGHFMEAYLARNGIIAVTGETSDPNQKLISALGKPDKYVAGDFKPSDMHFKNKLDEAKTLPGLEKSEDIATLMGKPVTHLNDEVIAKLDETYGKGQWIVKCYDDNAAAGYGIFFPQRAEAIKNDARNTMWASGGELGKYGFSHLRDEKGKVVGIKHSGGDEYKFGTEKYEKTIDGDVRYWADRAANAAEHENGSMLPEGSFMAQPAFKAVGISDAERAAGKTWHEKNEGRVHLVTRPNGSVEIVPHSTWLKGGNLPVVFEDDDTRAMAQAAKEAIEKIPLEARKGQVYAPDIMKTGDGYRVVELNAQGDFNGSGYLHDNHFTIDAYTSYLSGRQPAHVKFIRKLLTQNKGE